MTKPIRCAIYTRKSSEEGLDQAYNSLDAQRDACSAYVMSQAGEGWVLDGQRYDDGGFSGGNLERPALRALMADIEAGKIDVVVVYKIDRLTRSLADFSKIVEVLDRKGASFVSVTQAFNTTTSMGRLTLNVLLSFAQFEREVTGERIRDKITQSKKLGMWMGGPAPLGYRPAGRTLEVEPDEAEIVKTIFRRYTELKSVHLLKMELDRKGVRSKSWTTKSGKTVGGALIGRGPLFHILKNRIYLGEVPHKDTYYPGQHPAIIDPDLFNEAQVLLEQGRKRRAGDSDRTEGEQALFMGRITDEHGRAMTPIWTKGPNKPAYRYYVTRGLERGGPELMKAPTRAPAGLLEDTCLHRLRELRLISAKADRAEVRRAVLAITIGKAGVKLVMADHTIEGAGGEDVILRQLRSGEDLAIEPVGPTLSIPLKLQRRGLKTVAYGPGGSTAIQAIQVDPAMSAALIKAEAWKRKLLAGEASTVVKLAQEEGVAPTYAARVLRAAFLAPDLKASILEGRQPAGLTLQALMKHDLPLNWEDQRRLFQH